MYDSDGTTIKAQIYLLTITDLCSAHTDVLMDFGDNLVTTEFIAGDATPKLVARLVAPIEASENINFFYEFTYDRVITSPNGATLLDAALEVTNCATGFSEPNQEMVLIYDVTDTTDDCKTTDLGGETG